MKKTVWTFGLISGAIMSVMMMITIPFHDVIEKFAEILGYTTIVAAFLLIFFGIKSYRDNVGGGMVSFGRALAVGSLIALIASACYVATWETMYFGGLAPNLLEKHQEKIMERERADGATQSELDAKRAELQRFAEYYRNPAINAAVTFLEPLPIGLVIALISAGILRRKFA